VRSVRSKHTPTFPPSTPSELDRTGWERPDIVLVTGDAYVDHPSFGAALIVRVLEAEGFRVAVLPQPDWRSAGPFRSLKKPRLFFGITGGNVDSMVAAYTPFRNRRKKDAYSSGGRPGMRPNRATLVYAHRAREAYPDVPIVLGGVEASMRRLSHYDFWEDKVRRSALLDAKADIILYGMAEQGVVDAARALDAGESIQELGRRIRGVVFAADRPDLDAGAAVILPEYEEAVRNPRALTESFRLRHEAADPFSDKVLAEPYGARLVLQTPPPLPLSAEKLDALYEFPFTGAPHPRYKGKDIPALKTVETSIVTHRGCFGGCSFCGIGFHQGRIVQSRSIESMINEAKRLCRSDRFKGTINDLGGPSANMYGFSCRAESSHRTCKRSHCLYPKPCPHLKEGFKQSRKLLKEVRSLPEVKHAFIQSGIRFDLTLSREGLVYLNDLVKHHISGTLKVAPEHSESAVLAAMRKAPFDMYEEFRHRFDRLNSESGKRQFLVNYFISAHPGCSAKEMKELKRKLDRIGIAPEQVQDFTPLPGTASSVMFSTGLDPFTDKPVFVARTDKERRAQRRMIQPPG